MHFSFPHVKQHESRDCGPACLKMIAKHYGKTLSLEYLREKSYINKLGVSLLGISEAAEAIGFRPTAVKISFDSLVEQVILPCIVHWNGNHFVTIYKIKKNKIYVADPATTLTIYSIEEFLEHWSFDNGVGYALLLQPTPKFYNDEELNYGRYPSLWSFKSYLKPFKRHFVQIFIGLVVGFVITLATPFLFRALVDLGISRNDVDFVYALIVSQFILFLGGFSVQLISSWIMLHLGSRLHISIVSDFLMKMLKLPIGFFESKITGDLLQRIQDNKRIEQLLSATSVQSFFSIFSMIVSGIILVLFNSTIFWIVLCANGISVLWIFLFLRRRKILDYKVFDQVSKTNNQLINILQGISEIKLSNSEKHKRWEWERVMVNLFKVQIEMLSFNQMQQSGTSILYQIQNLSISLVSALAVMNGEMSFGAMMAVTMISGQFNGAVNQLHNFIITLQEAKISLERVAEIHLKKDESPSTENFIVEFPENQNITFQDVSFTYSSLKSTYVLKNLNFIIPTGKVTAIVGASGSGKTTLLKLLLKFYSPTQGKILLNQSNLVMVSGSVWREQCGVVMQDGRIFPDTVAKNIALGREKIDYEKLHNAAYLANIENFIEQLPNGYNTKIGEDGLNLSRGEIQRILLARAIFKNPTYVFLDEATSSLDSENEFQIMGKLKEFFVGRTVVIIAHRLSTVQFADQIIVLHKGEIVESGNHADLTENKRFYYNLVKNQLELGA
ncbi:MAG: peptidase domain-containing ABC transporter [Bacteroidota bacterium]